ncbi:glycosyltransferase family 2 protein [Chryseobacterium potabilaquae]|uniref:UDP-Glc:alpha-D-GlcNAc-diphosphoundecaprenol beta-1,3-glucosyltransferase WfgD n=1 Tax=Chryseobacterium potabilaquae TaxID=2675057 RepID=A0A6N4X7R6_9FLAO|nr:glycosyltransferase family 2 protein [Chryseobacterium potabilaquae]CAA7197057.1 UDP-Glc:alpha-D-GlcNAc-diphosphoundecaprenol beta-1,3-glucosyltransferase WfgD [Chryseobacterium potabilaquae]
MKVSVIIPVYNAEAYVVQAVESALQLNEVHEVIIVEDNSSDNSLGICRKLVDQYSRVKLFQHSDEGNHGAGVSRNLGIEKATGDFLAFLDADDYYLPNRFDAEKELFKNPKVDGVYGALGVHYYSENARDQYYNIYGDRLTTVYKKYAPKDVFPGQMYLLGSFGLFSIDALTIRRESLMMKMDVFFKTLRIHEDSEFFFRLSYYLDLYPGILNKAIAMRGIHEDNRITDIETRKIKPCTTKVLLWKEISVWSEEEKTIPEDTKLHIKRMYWSFQIANAPLLKKILMILRYLIIDCSLIFNGLYNINFRKLSIQKF